jgi:hypothetical protein
MALANDGQRITDSNVTSKRVSQGEKIGGLIIYG